ncbi:MAG: DUF72 domain-containing protein [Candidatus Hydrothermae bacterium]|nr:DUF72 domain-containing protein [Candidatus Hydrothermae bacterium]
MEIKVGVCGFPARLEKLDSEVDVIEIQKTFYKLPRIETVKSWKDRAPHVIWSVKANQMITHPPESPTYRKAGLEISMDKKNCYGYFRPTSEVFEVYKNVLALARAINARFILFQTPASFKPLDEHINNIRAFFRSIERDDNIIYLWEPRGWDVEILRKILPEIDVIHVVDPFKDKQLYGDICYFRLHGRGKGYKYDYSTEELRELLSMLSKAENYVLFNNTMMYKNALEFKELIGEKTG